MKFTAYTALIAAAAAKEGDACTDTWEGAAGCVAAEGDPAEQCYDWQKVAEDGSKTSSGLMCGQKDYCDATKTPDNKFVFKDKDGNDVNYVAACTGL